MNHSFPFHHSLERCKSTAEGGDWEQGHGGQGRNSEFFVKLLDTSIYCLRNPCSVLLFPRAKCDTQIKYSLNFKRKEYFGRM